MPLPRLSALFLFTAACSTQSPPDGAPDGAWERAALEQDVLQHLADARAATAKYHDLDVALADGYGAPVDHCVSLPGVGAMGVHYANFQLVLDGIIDPEHPEVLVYEPDPHGVPQLVAVEYIIPGTEAPDLFGEHAHWHAVPDLPFDNRALHAWVWRANPDGVFADFNSLVECPDEPE